MKKIISQEVLETIIRPLIIELTICREAFKFDAKQYRAERRETSAEICEERVERVNAVLQDAPPAIGGPILQKDNGKMYEASQALTAAVLEKKQEISSLRREKHEAYYRGYRFGLLQGKNMGRSQEVSGKISRPELIHDGNDVVSLGLYADQLEVELLQYQIELHLFREFLVQEIRRMKEKGEEVRLFQERIDQIDRCLRRES